MQICSHLKVLWCINGKYMYTYVFTFYLILKTVISELYVIKLYDIMHAKLVNLLLLLI